ncbi:DUF302 domain-containing protein [Amphritea sp. 2_MG-2023]|uniref:DUF302 domain-containing protein n=1 Tax=Amphritea TaxID=515417 RepID=UPI001C073FB5|nr:MULTISPECIES: DUF302 domain-containing protein [Amphritea]MBU2964554.1 DUF302 domain-containing protein [Amphritea atlantica]MDO6417883.1 DUF302 domain-containing protein [Amphritea sp. 2_MG-2023]MDX2421494.1 DUF302 domain-containing protein [Amphritea sp.]
MFKRYVIALTAILWGCPAFAAEGMVNIASEYSVEETADRLDTILAKKGMTVFNRVKHSDAAAKVNIELRDTQVIIFGNPKVGSPLMACQQTVAIDLPQKYLVWQDVSDKVWISYNDPAYLVKRHEIEGCDEVINKVTNALSGIASAAAK